MDVGVRDDAERAKLFERAHGAPESFVTLRAVIRTWTDRELAEHASERANSERRTLGSGTSWGFCFPLGDDDEDEHVEPPPILEHVARLWRQLPRLLREEVDGPSPHVRIRDGHSEWWYYPRTGGSQNAGTDLDDGGQHDDLFNPLARLPQLELELLGEAWVAGRPGWRVRARPRGLPDPEQFGGLAPFLSMQFGSGGADEIELVVDRERGIVLRREARLAGKPFHVVEITELELDLPLDPQLFVLQQVQPTPEPRKEREWLQTLEQIAARASFTVFVPAAIWPEATMTVSYMAPSEDPPSEERVVIQYADHSRHGIGEVPRILALVQRNRDAEPDDSCENSDQLSLDDDAVFAGEESIIARIERTRIDFHARGLTGDELLELADSLEPARTGPPPGFE